MGALCTKSAAVEPQRQTQVPLMCGMQPPDRLRARTAAAPATPSSQRGSSRTTFFRHQPQQRQQQQQQQRQQQRHRSVASSSASARSRPEGRRPSSASAASGPTLARRASDAGRTALAPSEGGSPVSSSSLPPPSSQLQQQQPLPAGFGVARGQPPHHMVSGELTRISCGLMFHIRVYGMKARCLELYGNILATRLRLEWAAPLPADAQPPAAAAAAPGAAAAAPGAAGAAGAAAAAGGAAAAAGEVLTLTTQPVKGRSPKWFEAFEFTWHASSLEQLKRRALVFSVVAAADSAAAAAAADPAAAAVVGQGSVSLFAVATGPVHHDVLLKGPDGRSQAGRLIMDLRMQQICDLIINPIEVLAHLGNSSSQPDMEDESSDDEDAEEATAHEVQSTGALTPSDSGKLAAAAATAATAATEAAATRAKSRRMVSQTSAVFCETGVRHLHSFDSRSRNFRSGERQRRQAAAAANRSSSKREEAAALAAAAAAGDDAAGEDDSSDLGQMEQLEQEEEPEPLSAHWMLSFSPTGVDNPREAFSVETKNVQQPYWNAVDHALLGHLLKATGHTGGQRREGSSGSTASTRPFSRSACSDNLRFRSVIAQPAASSTEDSLVSASSLPGYVESEGSSLFGDEEGGALEPPEPAEACYRRALELMANSEAEERPSANPDGGGPPASLLEGSGEGSGEAPSDEAGGPPIRRPNSEKKRHLGHLDLESTYQKLEAVAARGALVKDVLHDTFPTLRLSTTIDQLRQHYLRIRLHAKVFGSSSPTLYGECWLPFFKVYDADVVTTRPRQFFDSYFREKLWLDGKHVGTLEGVIVFQNNPVVRQVCAGVQTEKGLCRIFPLVLGHEHRPVCFTFSGAGNAVPPPVARIAQLHELLLHLIASKTQHKGPPSALEGAPHVASAVTAIITSVKRAAEAAGHGGAKLVTEVKAVCDELQHVLHASDLDSRRSFLFNSEAELLRTQRVLLNLANHTLEFLEYVFWQCRGDYCAVLCSVLRRGELDLGTILPARPEPCAALTLSEVYVLYACIKEENAEAAAAAASAAAASSGSSNASGAGGGSPGAGAPSVPKLFVFQRSIEFDINSSSAPASSGIGGQQQQQQQQGGGAPRVLRAGAVRPRLGGGGDGEGPRGYLGAALQRLRNAGIAVVPAGEAEAAAQLGRDLGTTKIRGSQEGEGQDEMDLWKKQHMAAVSPERKEQLSLLAKSLTAEARFSTLLYHKRLKLCRQFRLLLYRVLGVALRMLGGEASFGGQRRLACMLLAMTYFRLPDFRVELLRSVLDEEGRQAVIEEWRGTDFLLDPASLQAGEAWAPSSPLRLLLQWEVFHSVLTDYFGAPTLQEDLDSLQEKVPFDADWRHEVSPQGSSFFSFVEQWARSISHTEPGRTNLVWREIPGYSTLLKRLLLELKARNVCKYPDSLVSCTGAMLANEKLLSVFVKIVFMKTHAHNSQQVFNALTYVDFWAQLLACRGRQLPPNFDFAFLRKGLQMVVDSDLYLNVCKGLWFVYRNLPILNGEQLEEVLLGLCLQRNGLRLFLHWAAIVRRGFMWVLLYRLVEGMRRVIGRITGVEPSFGNDSPQQTFELQPGLIKQHQQQQQNDGVIASTSSKRIALSAEESVVIRGHSMLVAFLRSLSIEDILPADAVQIAESAEADTASSPAATAAAAAFGVLRAQPLRFEGSVSAPELQVYKLQAKEEFQREIDAYKAWVGEGASSLPTMVIPSAPLDATTDVPLEGWQ
ncbi:hypothetical protein Efla_006896 [Eimeria flavescens]